MQGTALCRCYLGQVLSLSPGCTSIHRTGLNCRLVLRAPGSGLRAPCSTSHLLLPPGQTLLSQDVSLPKPVPTPHAETGWDLGLFAVGLQACTYLDTPLLEQQNTKYLYGTKNNCMHEQLGQILDKRYKETKTPSSYF